MLSQTLSLSTCLQFLPPCMATLSGYTLRFFLEGKKGMTCAHDREWYIGTGGRMGVLIHRMYYIEMYT